MADPLRLHCYAAAFGHDFAAEQIRAHSTMGDVVLDPFVGSGTTLLHAQLLGRNAIGIDIDPIACLIAKVITTNYCCRILDTFRSTIHSEVQHLVTESRPANKHQSGLTAGTTFRLNGYCAKIPEVPEIDYWFSANQRQVLAALIQVAKSIRDPSLRDLFRLAISSSIIRKWPNSISRAMDIDHSRPHRVRPEVVRVQSTYAQFLRIFDKTLSTIRRISGLMPAEIEAARVIQGDAYHSLKKVKTSSVDLVLTSPPYVGAIDYPRAHKFAEWWLTPGKRICKHDNYVGLRKAQTSWDRIEHDCEVILGSPIKSITWVKRANRGQHARICQYIKDMNNIVRQLKRVIRPGGYMILVLANNRIESRSVPIVELISCVARIAGFDRVTTRLRRIKSSRRRYPFSRDTFRGPMTSEYIIKARA